MKKFHIENNDISDGYHTFDELYEHRILLWINLCLLKPKDCYWVMNHFDGWDLLLMKTNEGQMSYHVKIAYRYLYENKISECSIINHKWDKHTSSDVFFRLEAFAKNL